MTEEMEHNILPEEPVETQALTAARSAGCRDRAGRNGAGRELRRHDGADADGRVAVLNCRKTPLEFFGALGGEK